MWVTRNQSPVAIKTSVKVGSASPRVWALNCVRVDRVELTKRHACLHLPLLLAVAPAT